MKDLTPTDKVKLIGTDQKATVIMVFSESLVVHFDGQPEHLMTAISKDLFEKIETNKSQHETTTGR